MAAKILSKSVMMVIKSTQMPVPMAAVLPLVAMESSKQVLKSVMIAIKSTQTPVPTTAGMPLAAMESSKMVLKSVTTGTPTTPMSVLVTVRWLNVAAMQRAVSPSGKWACSNTVCVFKDAG